jgi:hypothetical protein
MVESSESEWVSVNSNLFSVRFGNLIRLETGKESNDPIST